MNGDVMSESHRNKDGLNSIQDKPAFVLYHTSGKIPKKIWYKNGNMHRNVNPAYIVVYYENCKIKKERWYLFGNPYRENNKPFHIKYNETGIVIYSA